MPDLAFRTGTWDSGIWHSVASANEYGLPAEFPANSTVLDVGAHIGAFTYAALHRKAQFVLAVEPDPENAGIWQHNIHRACRATDRALLLTAACWRSDQYQRTISLVGVGPNTGGSYVSDEPGEPVRAVPLDDVLRLAVALGGGPPRLLKLDCEGAEWPILFTSRNLGCVQEIVGEYHTARLAWDGPVGPEALGDSLRRIGFECSFRETDSRGLGLFHAWRGAPLCFQG